MIMILYICILYTIRLLFLCRIINQDLYYNYVSMYVLLISSSMAVLTSTSLCSNLAQGGRSWALFIGHCLGSHDELLHSGAAILLNLLFQSCELLQRTRLTLVPEQQINGSSYGNTPMMMSCNSNTHLLYSRNIQSHIHQGCRSQTASNLSYR